MTRRSYLQRIAQPLRPGDPVLFALPQAPAAERRPAAGLPTSRPAGPPTAPAPRLRPPGDAGAAETVVVPADERATPSQDVILPADPIAAAPPSDASAPRMPAVQRPRSTLASETHRTPPARAAQPEAPPREPPAFALAATRAVARGERGPEVRIEPPASSPASAAASAHPAAAMPASAEASAPRVAPVAREPESFPDARPPARTAMSATDAAPAPRVHIGTVEVRSAAPTLPPRATQRAAAAPRTDAAPIARGYAWRFGLVQG